MDQPVLSRIRLYPVKSLDLVEMDEVRIGVHGQKHDRKFAIVTQDGRFVNGKRTGRVNQLKATYNLDNSHGKSTITLVPRKGGASQTFDLETNDKALLTYLTDFFETPVRVVRKNSGGLMDIPKVSSVTVISAGSLQSLQWRPPRPFNRRFALAVQSQL